MDLTRLTQGEKIAGVSGIALILIMFIFKWFGLKAGVGGFTVEGSRNAWGSYGFIDIVLFITGVAAVGLAALAASETETGLPVAAGAIVAGLGALSGPSDHHQPHQPAGFRRRSVWHRHRSHSEDRGVAGADRRDWGRLRWLARDAGGGDLLRRGSRSLPRCARRGAGGGSAFCASSTASAAE